MRILERTSDRLVIETTPSGWDKLLFAAPILSVILGSVLYYAWGLTILSGFLLMWAPLAILFLFTFNSFFRQKHTYIFDARRDEYIIREQRGSKTKRTRGSISQLESLELETIGSDPPSFYIVARRKSLPRTNFEVEEIFSSDERAINTLSSFLEARTKS